MVVSATSTPPPASNSPSTVSRYFVIYGLLYFIKCHVISLKRRPRRRRRRRRGRRGVPSCAGASRYSPWGRSPRLRRPGASACDRRLFPFPIVYQAQEQSAFKNRNIVLMLQPAVAADKHVCRHDAVARHGQRAERVDLERLPDRSRVRAQLVGDGLVRAEGSLGDLLTVRFEWLPLASSRKRTWAHRSYTWNWNAVTGLLVRGLTYLARSADDVGYVLTLSSITTWRASEVAAAAVRLVALRILFVDEFRAQKKKFFWKK